MFRNLRPAQGTDLAELSRLAEITPVSDLLPSKLDDSILLSIALDLRRVEMMVKKDTEATTSLSVATYLVMKYLMHLAATKNVRKVSIQEESLFQAVQILSITVEREIVTRIVGVSDDKGDEYLLNSLRSIQA